MRTAGGAGATAAATQETVPRYFYCASHYRIFYLPVCDEEQALRVSQSHRRRVTEKRAVRLANSVDL
jgi:hypothetical protein